jgi:hypothetical protein
MSQQLGIILLIDVVAAIEANTLEGNTYLFDNMKLQGSEGLGTGKLISAINGTSYCDGSQANEQLYPLPCPRAFYQTSRKIAILRYLKRYKPLQID